MLFVFRNKKKINDKNDVNNKKIEIIVIN